MRKTIILNIIGFFLLLDAFFSIVFQNLTQKGLLFDIGLVVRIIRGMIGFYLVKLEKI